MNSTKALKTTLAGVMIAAASCAMTTGIANAQNQSARISEPGLQPYAISDNGERIEVRKSLTGKKGDPVNGRKVAIHRTKGNCLACHVMPVPEQQFHGQTGPSLWGVGNRLTEGEIRMQLINSKVVYPDTMMPSFYRITNFNRPEKKFVGKTILSAQEVEDVVAYLKTLTDDEPSN